MQYASANPIEKSQKLREFVEKIVRLSKPEKILLFGSWAWGKPTEDSDIDILVIKQSDQSRRDRERELRSQLYPAGVAFDLLVYTPEELKEKIEQDRNLFLEDIINNGTVIYADDKICAGLAGSR